MNRASEAELNQVETQDESLDEANRIILSDVVSRASGKSKTSERSAPRIWLISKSPQAGRVGGDTIRREQEFSHSLVWRWVQFYAPEINKRMRPHLKMSGTSYRLDEMYVKVGTKWKHLYRAVDSAGDTIEFMLSARHDVPAAKRFFRKLMRTDHRRLPFTIGTDKHASYPEAFSSSVNEKVLPFDCSHGA